MENRKKEFVMSEEVMEELREAEKLDVSDVGEPTSLTLLGGPIATILCCP